jgi:hypothetical protein
LDEGFTSLVLDEDGLTITDAIAPAASKGGGTYKALSKHSFPVG